MKVEEDKDCVGMGDPVVVEEEEVGLGVGRRVGRASAVEQADDTVRNVDGIRNSDGLT